ncbi:MAG: hypothetical protein VR65_12845 [Desulfobulbaceae bacterium BRH_c16a]|nr:MAG: hypothetical protein VR65_12845 [Desulfobulbaceae bacterium BRH_c16a]
MKIAYYMPFKPMGHVHPSGDLVIGTELYDYLRNRQHSIELISKLRCRWIYYRPLLLLRLPGEKRRILRHCRTMQPNLWLSYHSYYKAPDLLGPWCSRELNLPYVIFQGIYSTKRRRQLETLPGFLLNRKALLSADHVFTNKKRDHTNLERLLPEHRLSYIAPGIHPGSFEFSGEWRQELQRHWRIQDETVVMTAAMMRPGVKTEGIARVMESCAELMQRGLRLRLIIVGDGICRPQLEKKAGELRMSPDKVLFAGQIPRAEMPRYYSAADIFAFPGFEESLGMVYLEAQSCNLPVVACGDWGGGEAVVDGRTGLLTPAESPERFTTAIGRLIEDRSLRLMLAGAAGEHIRAGHDLQRNYSQLEDSLVELAAKYVRPL